MTLTEVLRIELIALVPVLIWIYLYKEIKPLRKLRMRLNYKPFNCLTCLSFWTGVILSIIYLEPALLTTFITANILSNYFYEL